MKSLRTTVIVLICLLATAAGQVHAATPLTAQLAVSGLSSPVYVCSPPGDRNRLFIVEQGGRIRIHKNGSLLPVPFLDIHTIISTGGERGLLGLAFHPDYAANGYFYVNYTNVAGNTVIARYQVSANPDSANQNSAFTILTVAQPFSNHNGGMLAFGPVDGYLYIGMGDGGSGGDPQNNAQNPQTLLGKLLRIDVDGGVPYSVPPDNPFVGAPDTLDEIWAFGLRNPWRYSFDRAAGDLYIGDVGQNALEEIDFQSNTSSGGENYGWRLKEGTSCYNPPSNCDPAGVLIDPIHQYTHGGSPFRCSVTGGYVYRGCAIPDLQGTYFFGDYCSGQVWSFRYNGSTVTEFQDRTTELGLPAVSVSSFGENANGEIYIVAYNLGRIYKIVPNGVPSQCNCCDNRGNVDGVVGAAGPVDVADLTFLVAFLFQSGGASPCDEEGNVDALVGPAGPIDTSDLTYLVAFLFQGGSAPTAC
ncbi:MAG TPA: PQQ-dependent sugar dehydrogenase [Candidatus Deferrimicrobium sp.]|nr:PQQ-dependent sugar dehydrogenase [Candidatus Deferrimicrobium sp.]